MPAPALLPVLTRQPGTAGPGLVPNHTRSCSHREQERPPLPPRHNGCEHSSKFSSVQKRALRVICCSLKAAEVNYRAMKYHTLILLHSPWLGCCGTLLRSGIQTRALSHLQITSQLNRERQAVGAQEKGGRSTGLRLGAPTGTLLFSTSLARARALREPPALCSKLSPRLRHRPVPLPTHRAPLSASEPCYCLAQRSAREAPGCRPALPR